MNYILRAAISAFIIVLAIAEMHFVSDAYYLFDSKRIEGFNFNKPVLHLQEKKFKRTFAQRRVFEAVLLGNSRVNHGFNLSQWPEESGNSANLAYGGQSFRQSLSVLDLAYGNSGKSLRKAFLALDFFHFRSLDTKPADAEPAPNKIGSKVKNLITLFGVLDNVETIKKNWRKPGSKNCHAGITPYDLRTGYSCNYLGDQTNEYTRTEREEKYYCKLYRDSKIDEDLEKTTLKYIKEAIRYAANRNIKLTIFIAPIHARHLEVISYLARWPDYEKFKRLLVTLTQGTSATVWDFTSYDPEHLGIFTPTSDSGATKTNPFYFESTHFRPEVGDVVLNDLLEKSPPKMGRKLSSENIEQHLESLRIRSQKWRESVPLEAAEVHAICDATSLRVE